jgi:sugar phosphate isomerase/epimerase
MSVIAANPSAAPKDSMFKSLNTSMVGIRATCAETLALAQRHGFGGVDLNLRDVQKEGLADLAGRLAAHGLRAGVAGGLLPGRLAVDAAEWDGALATLPSLASQAQAAGFRRTTIVLLPFHETLPFEACLALCVTRLRQVAAVLGDHGLAVGVEYVSQRTRRAGQPHTFVHDLAGTLGMIDAVGAPNVGILLDSFHWHCAGESLEALRALPPGRIVAVHLADAPDRPLAEQVAFERALPGEGVADLRGFCAAVRATGYDGPAACEPFCKAFNDLPADTVADRVGVALDNVMG